MRAWSVTARGSAAVQVRGRNWIVALGRGLDELGRADVVTRLACEVLPNGTVIARDVSSGVGYVVQAVDDVGEDEPVTAETAELPMPGEPDEQEQEEDGEGEPLFELPADALSEVSPDEDVSYPILRAETAVEACQLALSIVAKELGAESGAVLLKERGVLRFVAVQGPAAAKLSGVRMPFGSGGAGFAMERRRSVILDDAQSDPRHLGEIDGLTGYVTRGLAVVPLVDDEEVVGVLEVINLPEGRRFDESHLQLLHQIADTLTVRLRR